VQKNDAQEQSFTTIEEGTLLDYITNRPVADNAKEQVRQRLARALFHEYGISVDDMEPDFRLKIDGRTKKVDIAIFAPGSKHTQETVRRIVICQKEPPSGTRSAYKMSDHKQAEKELGLLKAAMIAAEGCRYGLWTNGLDFFFFEKEKTRFDEKFIPLGYWPTLLKTCEETTLLTLHAARKLAA
jgi:type I restriction enzyme M protein